MRECGPDTAAVQVDDLAVLAAGEDDAPAEGIAAVVIDQADFQQQIERTAPGGQMTAEVSAQSITDAEFLGCSSSVLTSAKRVWVSTWFGGGSRHPKPGGRSSTIT